MLTGVNLNKPLSDSELILNADGSIYHLNLRPEDLATTVITVGDPERVAQVSKYFDSIELKKQKREFITHTGFVGNKRISVISTGIGVNTIDIVINEMDALVNIDFELRQIKPELTQLNIIRLGTAGALNANIAIDSVVATDYAIGLDGLMSHYQFNNDAEELQLLTAFNQRYPELNEQQQPYIAGSDNNLLQLFKSFAKPGITFTCAGFYAPQMRALRAKPRHLNLIKQLASFEFAGHSAANFEMETAAIYGLGKLLGHKCCSLSSILANRVTNEFSRQPAESVERMIRSALEVI